MPVGNLGAGGIVGECRGNGRGAVGTMSEAGDWSGASVGGLARCDGTGAAGASGAGVGPRAEFNRRGASEPSSSSSGGGGVGTFADLGDAAGGGCVGLLAGAGGAGVGFFADVGAATGAGVDVAAGGGCDGTFVEGASDVRTPGGAGVGVATAGGNGGGRAPGAAATGARGGNGGGAAGVFVRAATGTGGGCARPVPPITGPPKCFLPMISANGGADVSTSSSSSSSSIRARCRDAPGAPATTPCCRLRSRGDITSRVLASDHGSKIGVRKTWRRFCAAAAA